MMRFLRALARVDDHWSGDLIGVICLAGIAISLLYLGAGLGFK